MKVLLVLAMMFSSINVFAGDMYLSCWLDNADSDYDFITEVYLDPYKDEYVELSFNDMITDKYTFDVKYNHKTYDMTMTISDMNSGLVIEERNFKAETFQEYPLMSGHYCIITD